MAGHWKGHSVNIVVRQRLRYGSKEVANFNTLLDTDTMLDLFDQYPPDEHHYLIYPRHEDAD